MLRFALLNDGQCFLCVPCPAHSKNQRRKPSAWRSQMSHFALFKDGQCILFYFVRKPIFKIGAAAKRSERVKRGLGNIVPNKHLDSGAPESLLATIISNLR